MPAYTPKNYERVVLQLDNLAVTQFLPENEPHWFAYARETESLAYRPIGRWFSSAESARAYVTGLEDRTYTRPELLALTMPAAPGTAVAPSVLEHTMLLAQSGEHGSTGRHCPRCQQPTRELLTSAAGLVCPDCFDAD